MTEQRSELREIQVTPKAIQKIRQAFAKEGRRVEGCVWACWAAAARG